jgi:hypothetical protein
VIGGKLDANGMAVLAGVTDSARKAPAAMPFAANRNALCLHCEQPLGRYWIATTKYKSGSRFLWQCAACWHNDHRSWNQDWPATADEALARATSPIARVERVLVGWEYIEERIVERADLVHRQCEQCRQDLLIDHWRARWGRIGRHCTIACREADRNAKRREARRDARAGICCDVCGQPFEAPRSDARYCSPACRQKAYRRRVKA